MSKKEMLINYVGGEECRIAIVEDGRLEELYQERASVESHVGNIYKGVVVNVEPSIQAVFVDFGLERNGFLHISDLHPMYFGGDAKEDTERVGKKTPRRERPPIQKCLRRGQEILVQVLKEGIGTKGPTLTSYLSIPGRFVVMMPYMERLGVSRKVEDDDARRETRKVLDELDPPKGFGFIIRTAGVGRTKTDLKRDLAYLQRLWKAIESRRKSLKRAGELYTEADLIIRTLRDVYSTDIDRIIADDPVAAKRAADFLAIASPRAKSPVFVYQDAAPLFHRFDIESQIESIQARTVPLPSGGSLVFDQTEALVAIDVNSGKMRDNKDAETTAYKTNREAVDEISRQLRLRDLGGVIVNDLIDMRSAKHRREIEQRFRDNMKHDRARTKVLSISQLGLIEMTRQRMRPSLKKSVYADCGHCGGSGHVKSPESVVLDVMRRLVLATHHDKVARVELTVSPDVAFILLNRRRAQLNRIEERYGKPIMVRVNGGGPIDYINLAAFDQRDSAVEAEVAVKGGKPTLLPATSLTDVDDLPESEQETPRPQTGKGGAPPPATHEAAVVEPDESDETPSESPDEGAGEGEGKKRKRRRRRGGRGRRRKKAGQTDGEQVDAVAEPAERDRPADKPAPTDADRDDRVDRSTDKPERPARDDRPAAKPAPRSGYSNRVLAKPSEKDNGDGEAVAAEAPQPEAAPKPDEGKGSVRRPRSRGGRKKTSTARTTAKKAKADEPATAKKKATRKRKKKAVAASKS